MSSSFFRTGIRTATTTLTAASIALSIARPALAEPASCASPNPPLPSKPYFMLLLDASDSMSNGATPNVCTIANGYSTDYPTNKIGGARCAIYNTVAAFGGQTNFGLAVLPANQITGNVGPAACPAAMTGLTGCTEQFLYASNCGSGSGATRKGANIVVPMQQDNYWDPPALQTPSNLATVEQWVDNVCSDCKEITLANSTPINGALRDMYRYFSDKWTNPLTNVTYDTPLKDALTERPCRTVNVILMTDGAETCDTVTDAANAAAALFAGFTIGVTTWKVKTFVIHFGAAVPSAGNQQIATAGGTTAVAAQNDAELSAALAAIIATGIQPEVCDNADNNCNGCTDEGFTHYCDVQPIPSNCCSLPRATCLTNYKASITQVNPKGDITLLPCTTAVEQQDPLNWLCYDPGEKCDNVDNNCQGGVDEGVLKCGNPLHCPGPETCNGVDDNCNGVIDEGCPVACFPTPEVCDGCDNDCNGIADEGVAPIPCGPTGPGEPANCQGFLVCKPAVAVPPSTCVAGGGFLPCNNNPQTEICDNLDNDCNGIIDDNVPAVDCVPNGTPGNLVYGGTSQCKKGKTACVNGMTVCQGFVGPSPEICDGIDNDCDGQVDEQAAGAGQTCGVNQPPCAPGTTACVGGVLVCQGGSQPKPEVCNGIDDDCDGQIDEAPLADGPAPGMNGCWIGGGICCSFPAVSPTLFWCAPPGAACNGSGSLVSPCGAGTLACSAGAWVCQNPKPPGVEVCNGIDDDCNGLVDDGALPGVGDTCGSATPPCSPGVKACVNGVLTCTGGVEPSSEACNGVDDDCNGLIDDGIPVGGSCVIAYDQAMYPGDRTHLPCQPGVLACDGNGGTTCLGGIGPSPEVCDGIDNDCDGVIDEIGSPPDGIDGTSNPFPPPAAAIGDVCGSNQGECKEGAYACVNGAFACLGGQAGQTETCDCKDNDCDGQVDNPAMGGVPICSAGKDCISSTFGCQCAEPCDPTKEFPCPGGQTCQDVTFSQTGQPAGKYCISDPCGDCKTKTVKDPVSKIICAPAGAAPDPDTCLAPPVCVCKGQSGCEDPCFGVVCTTGTVCKRAGQGAGSCVADSCFENPCPCDKVCNDGSCMDDPCALASCKPDEECKPSADFTSFTCITPCADANCAANQVCVAGQCVDGCSPPCAADQVCDTSQSPPVCVPDKCQPNPCTNNACCNPLTGLCGNCPCEGVHCPSGQVCQGGECVEGGGTGGSDAGTSSSSSSGEASSSSGATGSGGSDNGIWGLATGGGGCSCEVGPGLATRLADGRWAFAVLALLAARRRRRRRVGGAGEGGAA